MEGWDDRDRQPKAGVYAERRGQASSWASSGQPGSQAEMALYRDLAMFYAWVGNVAETLSWLEPAFAWSHNAVQFEVMKCGIFDRVSDDPDFQSGLERIHSRARARLLQEVDR